MALDKCLCGHPRECHEKGGYTVKCHHCSCVVYHPKDAK